MDGPDRRFGDVGKLRTVKAISFLLSSFLLPVQFFELPQTMQLLNNACISPELLTGQLAGHAADHDSSSGLQCA